jgi:plastocyanin
MTRRVLYFGIAALLGAAVAVVPTVASGTSPPTSASFTAVDYAWDVSGGTSHQATIAQGGTVTFSYPTGSSAHNADFGSVATPSSCAQTAGAESGSVPPVPHAPTAPGWSGNCTFNTPGTYTFHCDLHPGMTATIIVQGPGGTSTATSPAPTTAAPTTTTTTASAPTGTGTTSPLSQAKPSPLAGNASTAVKIARVQRGSVIRGLADVSGAGASGTLLIQLLVRRSGAAVLAGRRTWHAIHRGAVRFSVPLNPVAKRQLALRKRLTVTVKLTLSSPRSTSVQLTRRVSLRT